MKVGFAKNDITPRVGVELCGFMPYLGRRSIAVRDQLWARAMAMEHGDTRAILVTCDLVGTKRSITNRVRDMVAERIGVPHDAVMIVSSHTHSGPNAAPFIGCGEPDPVYVETLPSRIAKACLMAWENLQEAEFAHAEVPCEGVGLNREYDKDAPPLDEVLQDDWRPAKPELTDTTCHVITARAGGRVLGFASYFGCHPVVCCQTTRYIHGDYPGVATNLLEREHPGSVGLFLQGAEGDVNSCVVHKPEQEALLALDVIAARYANAVRKGMVDGTAFEADALKYCRHEANYTRKEEFTAERLREILAGYEAKLSDIDARDMAGEEGREMGMNAVWATSIRGLLARHEAGRPFVDASEVQGLRIGPVSILGSGFETFQAIKNEVVEKAAGPITLVTSMTNDCNGYAPDHTAAARGGYAADLVPFVGGNLPYANIHDELVEVLLGVDEALR
jgi:Neutral/alkaline non-lysosomal ceramidase, N-terminal